LASGQKTTTIALAASAKKGRSRLGRLLKSPPAAAVLGFVGAAIVGAILFLLPGSTREPLSLVDAFFLSMSAVCVTGLVPVPDLTAALTEQGIWILFGLLQLGGVGIVFLGALILSFFGGRLPVAHAQALREGFAHRKGGVRRLVLRVGVLTLLCEALGALVLRARLDDSPTPWRDAIFHAASAFCNAGFSTFQNGLVSRGGDAIFVLATATLIVTGGLGFTTLSETAKAVLLRRRLSLHARIVWRTSLALLVLGAIAFYLFERRDALAALGPLDAATASIFHSATARTAGFNTLDMALLRPATLLLMVALMVIGGSPGSTAGGIKTVTVATALAALRSMATGAKTVVIGRRAIAADQVQRAMLIVLIHLGVLAIAVIALTLSCEDLYGRGVRFLDVLFESASALGTVGLSTGLTPRLPDGGKLLIAFVMLAGRVGPLTVVLAVTAANRAEVLRPPEERVYLG
jgi:trk system potassium uptake protein